MYQEVGNIYNLHCLSHWDWVLQVVQHCFAHWLGNIKILAVFTIRFPLKNSSEIFPCWKMMISQEQDVTLEVKRQEAGGKEDRRNISTSLTCFILSIFGKRQYFFFWERPNIFLHNSFLGPWNTEDKNVQSVVLFYYIIGQEN